MPLIDPSVSMMAAVVVIQPLARFSNRLAMITALAYGRAFPGIGAGPEWSRRLEETVIFDLAIILRAEKLLRTEDLSALFPA